MSETQHPEGLIRVLVVDDSAYVRKVVRQMLERSPFIEVIGVASDGEDALEMVERLKPDVVTLDLMMPNVDGIAFLERQMARAALPVVIVSIASETGQLALKALEKGAIDFVQKPTALASEKVFEIADELVRKVKEAARVPVATINRLVAAQEPKSPTPAMEGLKANRAEIVVIGASTGGPQALRHLIPLLPQNFPLPVAMVMHMPVGYTEMYANKLNEISALEVREACEGDLLKAGTVLLAPAGRHMSFERQPSGEVAVHLDARPFDSLHRPSVDVLFQSAAKVYSNRVLGVILTGMGNDGTVGGAWIKSNGGLLLTEAEESCVVYGMPRAAVEAGLSDRAAPLEAMCAAILDMI